MGLIFGRRRQVEQKSGLVFVACGAATTPARTVVNGGNPVGFVAPIALVFLVALCRQRWGPVTTMVVLAALVKPQFAVLAVALFAAGSGGWVASRWPAPRSPAWRRIDCGHGTFRQQSRSRSATPSAAVRSICV